MGRLPCCQCYIGHYNFILERKKNCNDLSRKLNASKITCQYVTIVTLEKKKMEERYAFTAEWYDPNAALIRRYLLNYYPSDNACEMVDLKSRKLFLKRSPCEHVTLKDLFIGAVVNIHSRQLNITQYGDEFTERKLKSKKEKTLGIIKPDCSAGKVGQIWDRVAREGFLISQARMVQLSQEEAREFYAEHRGKPFFEKLVGFMTEGPVVAFEITGEDAVARWRHVLGPTDSSVARQEAPGSLRAHSERTRHATRVTAPILRHQPNVRLRFSSAGREWEELEPPVRANPAGERPPNSSTARWASSSRTRCSMDWRVKSSQRSRARGSP